MSDDKTKGEIIKEVEAIKEKTSDKKLQDAIADKAKQMQHPVSK